MIFQNYFVTADNVDGTSPRLPFDIYMIPILMYFSSLKVNSDSPSPLLMLGAARCICVLVICLSYTFALG